MFSMEQKKKIADAVEKILLDINHPEMPKTKPMFHLRVEGQEFWSFAEIDPNWTFDEKNKPGTNDWNEKHYK